ncbi:hypothetical protein KVR01_007656 [Diaporthe batatas]|uniref:uncharacterized protein n=1 Tax=Diaporthe batatas TaxID=748121 RepID=UPI001D03677A|nr:uncharacterized protein KVR01_007656 [Diaporthe batatas]KAG8163178.1 hypothetical protein KVR01_007656 [Diaporthe batatas]
MHVQPSITVDTSDLEPPRRSREEPWNPVDASANGRRVALPDTSSLSPPPLQEATSQVGDYGDNKYLGQPKLSPRQSLSPIGNGALDQLGASFSAPSDGRAQEDCDARSTAGESISLQSNELSDLIRQKGKDAVSAERRTFYPISDLEEVVTRTTARQELGNRPDVEEILDHIFVPRIVSNHKTRAFKIFVILTLMGKPEAIRDFIDDETYDLDLPIERPVTDGTSTNRDQYIRNPQIMGRGRREINIFKRWAAADTESFVEKQHAVCVPIFDFDTQPGAPVSHYNLHGQTVLPYIENGENGSRGEGRSDVWKVKIHPAHIICQEACPDMSLAVKQLKHRVGKPFTEEAEKFIKEARNLRRFASRDHDFIIKLLCTFQWRGHYYFLFPWADGNLYDFWSRHPTPLAHLKQPSTARWLSEQCLGLTRALRDIHRGDSHSTLHLAPHQKNHGKHGDIKPENILYFKTGSSDGTAANEACRVQLKISDLGEAEFHSTTSMEVDAMGVLHTPSYSAPELRVKKVSMPNYDIFSLACVLLEFVTWYVHGFDGVKSFHEKRLKEQEEPVYNFRGDFKVDSFFKHVTVRMDESRNIGAMHKSSVIQEIDELLQHHDCSDYISDLLVFIKGNLLRMNPQNRANCDTIYKKFEELDRQCRADDDYCVERLKQAPARAQTDMSLVTEIDISKHIIKIMTDSRDGESGQVQIKVERRSSHPQHPIGGPPPASSLPVGQSGMSQVHLLCQPSSSEKGQMGQDVNEPQERAASERKAPRPEDPLPIMPAEQDIQSPINQDLPSKTLNTAPGYGDLLGVPGGKTGQSPSSGSCKPGDNSRNSEQGGGSSTWSVKRSPGRSPSEEDRVSRGPRSVRAKALRFFRWAFSCFK